MYELNGKLIKIEEFTDWKKEFCLNVNKRLNYNHNSESLNYSQIALMVLGTNVILDEYFDDMMQLHLSKNDVILIDKGIEHGNKVKLKELPFIIEDYFNQSLHSFTQKMKKYSNYNDKEIESLILYIKEKFIYLMSLKFDKFNFVTNIPSLLWFGGANIYERWLIVFLIDFGFDVIIFNPYGDNFLKKLPINLNVINLGNYSKKLLNFPLSHSNTVITMEKKANQLAHNLLREEKSLNYSPFQLRDYFPYVVRISSTYEQIFQYSNDDVLLRDGFYAKDGVVFIPTFFSKINGISDDEKDFYLKINRYCDRELIQIYTHFPNVKMRVMDMGSHYNSVLTDNVIDPNKLIQSKFWTYKQLNYSSQMSLAISIINFINHTDVKIFDAENDSRNKVLLGQAMDIPNELISLYSEFDFPRLNPGVLFFNNGNIGQLNNGDAILMDLLHFMGFDVLIYNTTRSLDIEKYLDPINYDVFELDKLNVGEDFNKRNNLAKKSLKRTFMGWFK